MTLLVQPHVTPVPWHRTLEQYGTEDTYRLAAEWLNVCTDVADWGGAKGYFRRFLRPDMPYTIVDGTVQNTEQVVADLTNYETLSDGILLRHVIDNTPGYAAVLRNALEAFRHRMVLVTFTPDAEIPTRIDHKNGWPIWHLNPVALRRMMGPLLVRDAFVQTTHPERIYFLEKPR